MNKVSRRLIVFSLALPLAWMLLPRAIRHAIHPTAFAAPKTFTVNVTGDGQDANVGDGVCQTSIAGHCSLRAAIEEANANAGKDTINFNIPGAGVHTISPNSALPEITAPVIIDGYSQPGASQNTLATGDNAVLLVELSGANPAIFSSALRISAGDSTVRGLVINRFVGAIVLVAHDGNTIQGNFIGTNAAGTAALGNAGVGIIISSDNNTIGGTAAGARNIISGTEVRQGSVPSGILIDGSGNTIQGNYIGTDAGGTVALGNAGFGIRDFGGKNNLIGGTVAGARNVISGNLGIGIQLFSEETSGNKIQGNYIGTDAGGTAALANTKSGVEITFGIPSKPMNNLIGGTTPAARNVISGNGEHGILFDGAISNQVQGNFIGTDASGTAPLGNTLSGISMNSFDDNNTIGGAVGLGNVIAFNGKSGVEILGSNVAGNAVLSNSIFSNSGLGIDLAGDGVTANDASDGDTGPNNLQNFPVISSAVTNGANTTVTGSMDATPNVNVTIQFFANPTCDPSGNGEGQTFVGSINKTTGADGHFMFSSAMASNVPAGQLVTATATDSANNTSEFSQCVQVTTTTGPTPTPTPTPGGGAFAFGQSAYSIFEDCAALTVTVTRSGDNSTQASVEYATQSVTASERSDFDTAVGLLQFAPGETSKAFDILVGEDSFTEGPESFTVSLSNPSGASLGSPASATVQIFDDPPEPSTNTIDAADGFVCQHYHDFLNREGDSTGLDFWANQIEACGSDAHCRDARRVNVSAAFFLSIEFQETGGFAVRVQRAAFGKKSDTAASRVTYRQFVRDARQVGEGVVVGQPGFEARLEGNKQVYTTQVVTSADFIARYPTPQTADQYVDALFASAGVTPTSDERQAAAGAFGAGGTAGRVAALRSVSDSASVRQAEFAPSFVLMQYFGYLRRNPTDAPDADDSGYQFWLAKLKQFGGNFQKAEMVRAFITSIEYRSRFGQP